MPGSLKPREAAPLIVVHAIGSSLAVNGYAPASAHGLDARFTEPQASLAGAAGTSMLEKGLLSKMGLRWVLSVVGSSV